MGQVELFSRATLYGQVELAVLSLASRVFYGRTNDEALRAAFPPAHVPVRYRPGPHTPRAPARPLRLRTCSRCGT